MLNAEDTSFLLTDKKVLIKLPRNPLHIIVPTPEQIDFADSLFGH